MARTPEQVRRGRERLSHWWAIVVPPLAFLVNLQVGYSLVALDCARSLPAVHASSLATLLACCGAGWLAWREWRRTGKGWPGEEPGSRGRGRFLVVLGALSAGLFALLILAQWLAVLMLPACAGA